jgi:Arc/MetJ family transcription regulator
MRSIKPTTIRLTEDDKKLIERMRERYGLASTIQAIRLALRMAVDSGNDSQATKAASDDRTGMP